MTVQNSTSKQFYVGNGVVTTFSYPFKITDASQMNAVVSNLDGTESSLLTQGVDYSVSGVDNDSGGSVNYPLTGDPMPSDRKLLLFREMPLTQLIDLYNGGNFLAELHEEAFDNFVMITQQLEEQLDRCLKVSLTSGKSGGVYEGDADEIIAAIPTNIEIDTWEGVASVGQTVIEVEGFTLAASLDNIEVFLDGVKQAASTLTRTSNTQITIGGPLAGGESIELRSTGFLPSTENELYTYVQQAQAAAQEAEAAVEQFPDDDEKAGKSGWLLVVNGTEDGYTLIDNSGFVFNDTELTGDTSIVNVEITGEITGDSVITSSDLSNDDDKIPSAKAVKDHVAGVAQPMDIVATVRFTGGSSPLLVNSFNISSVTNISDIFSISFESPIPAGAIGQVSLQVDSADKYFAQIQGFTQVDDTYTAMTLRAWSAGGSAVIDFIACNVVLYS